MKLKIAVLAGDGIGPEIMEQGVAVMSAVAQKFGHEVSYKEALCGAHAIDEVGDPFPEETFQTCMDADAVLFASVGDPKFDNNPTAKVRPEQGLLAMRKKLGLFANIRPVETFDCLVHKSPLKDDAVLGNAAYGCRCFVHRGLVHADRTVVAGTCIYLTLFFHSVQQNIAVVVVQMIVLALKLLQMRVVVASYAWTIEISIYP